MNTEIHPLRLVIKALCLFTLVNIVYALVDPQVDRVSAYNVIFPGRARMPFGDGDEAFAVMVDNVDAMIASHAVSGAKAKGEYRVLLVGDSSVWGENLTAQQSLSEQWNKLNLRCGDRVIKAYNLGYPHPSVIKDLIVLDKAMEYEPDLIIWFVTLNTLIPRRLSPFLAANQERALRVLSEYDIPFAQEKALLESKASFYQQTLIGERSHLARLIKLQALGLIWTATGTDTGAPLDDEITISPDVDDDLRYRGMKVNTDLKEKILFSALAAGHNLAGSVPILLVNEPMYIASGVNKEVRYNDVYPRWAFDQYREVMFAEAQKERWNYLDLWDSIPSQYFPHTTLHPSAEGERLLVELINPAMQAISCH